MTSPKFRGHLARFSDTQPNALMIQCCIAKASIRFCFFGWFMCSKVHLQARPQNLRPNSLSSTLLGMQRFHSLFRRPLDHTIHLFAAWGTVSTQSRNDDMSHDICAVKLHTPLFNSWFNPNYVYIIIYIYIYYILIIYIYISVCVPISCVSSSLLRHFNPLDPEFDASLSRKPLWTRYDS